MSCSHVNGVRENYYCSFPRVRVSPSLQCSYSPLRASLWVSTLLVLVQSYYPLNYNLYQYTVQIGRMTRYYTLTRTVQGMRARV